MSDGDAPRSLSPGPRPVISGAALLVDRTTGDYRYRVAVTPLGYLITARSRDAVGLLITERWLHREREAALACAAAVEAAHLAWKAMNTGHFGGALAAMQRATETHNEICERLGDPPVIGRDVEALRKVTLPE